MGSLLVKHARVLATMDADRREIADGGLYAVDGFIERVMPRYPTDFVDPDATEPARPAVDEQPPPPDFPPPEVPEKAPPDEDKKDEDKPRRGRGTRRTTVRRPDVEG